MHSINRINRANTSSEVAWSAFDKKKKKKGRKQGLTRGGWGPSSPLEELQEAPSAPRRAAASGLQPPGPGSCPSPYHQQGLHLGWPASLTSAEISSEEALKSNEQNSKPRVKL